MSATTHRPAAHHCLCHLATNDEQQQQDYDDQSRPAVTPLALVLTGQVRKIKYENIGAHATLLSCVGYRPESQYGPLLGEVRA